jgi:N-acetylneuraminic acid mutarotase
MKTVLAVAAGAIVVVAVAGVLGARGPGGDAQARSTEAPWRFAAAMSQRRSYLAAAELDGQIYAAGGMVGETGRFLSVFQRFDPRANEWTTLRRLPEPTRAAAGAALDGQVYVFGGQTENGVTRRVLAYDVAAGEWRARAP